LLEVNDVFSGYGAIEVLHGISISVGDKRIVSIIGGNGAGKSTLLNTISGLIRTRKGSIVFQGTDITTMRPHKISHLGLVQVPEGRQIFGPLSVYENLLLGCYAQRKSLGKEGIKADLDRVFGIYPILSKRKKQIAGTMSGGEQQMLAIGRALMARPKLLLLDEPSQGLAPMMVAELGSVLQGLNNEGLPIMLVEQNASIALALAHYAYVLSLGSVAEEGSTKELENNPKVKEIYLGERS
jgi:branched-chain amino acid transport system ATP-binding protein